MTAADTTRPAAAAGTLTTTAAVCRAPGTPWEITELRLDPPRAHEVRVRFHAAGLCRSDDHIASGETLVRLPMVGGHEGAGVVESVGPDVTRVRPGQRIVCSYIPACGTCGPCSGGHQNMCEQGLNAFSGMFPDGTWRFHDDGGPDVGAVDVGGFCTVGSFSEYAVVSEWAAVPLDDDIPFELAALVGCGVPTGWGSAVHAAGVRAGQTVVVYGCGGVGSNAVQGARHAGASAVVVVDPVAFKRESSALFGATHAVADAAAAHELVAELTGGRMADHAICTPTLLTAEVTEAAVAVVGAGGQVTLTAMSRHDDPAVTVPASALVDSGKRVRGALFGDSNPLNDIPHLFALYRSGRLRLDELVSRRYRLDQVNEGYADLDAGLTLRGVVRHREV